MPKLKSKEEKRLGEKTLEYPRAVGQIQKAQDIGNGNTRKRRKLERNIKNI